MARRRCPRAPIAATRRRAPRRAAPRGSAGTCACARRTSGCAGTWRNCCRQSVFACRLAAASRPSSPCGSDRFPRRRDTASCPARCSPPADSIREIGIVQRAKRAEFSAERKRGRPSRRSRPPREARLRYSSLMAQSVEFPSNGGKASGYLVTPASGSGPGILVIQEWWGLDSGIKEMADRLGEAGFVALAPDLYHGELAGHTEMDKAAKLMQSMPPDRAGRDMSAAIDYLAQHSAVTSKTIGVVGFCMGGLLSFLIAANRPDKVKTLVPFYGFPQGDQEPDWSKLDAKVRGHMAENDSFFSPPAAHALEAKLRGMGKDVTLTVYPGSGHAFMAPHNALGTRDEALAARIWPEVIMFLKENVR